MRIRSKQGFTLIELLIVVAIIGIIAAIAIPNLLNAIQRGKQKRTMADMRSIGTAVESYQVDNGIPPNNTAGDAKTQLSAVLEPTFIRQLPSLDGWKGTVQWAHASGSDEYTLQSYGKGSVAASCTINITTKGFTDDLCYSNGQFTQYPEGTQQ